MSWVTNVYADSDMSGNLRLALALDGFGGLAKKNRQQCRNMHSLISIRDYTQNGKSGRMLG
jgi:hypothetical protein